MKEVKNLVVKQWFQKAENDIKNIQNNLKSEDLPTDTICFHAQQAVAKLLKGTLVYFEREITKTYDLIRLLSDLDNLIPEIENLKKIRKS